LNALAQTVIRLSEEGKRTLKKTRENPTKKTPPRVPKDVGAVVNALRILRCLSGSSKPLGVAAVTRATGISASTAFGILRTLARLHYVSFNESDKTYRLGLAMAEMAAGLLGTSHAELIRPELERLALNYETLILLWRITEDNRLVLIDRAHSQTAVRVEIKLGYRMPQLAGAIGRCVAAILDVPSSELRRRFAIPRWQTPLSFDDFEKQVCEARHRGWALDDGYLFRGLTSVAALVVDDEKRPRFGISGVSITGQQSPQALTALGQDLVALAATIGSALFPGPDLLSTGRSEAGARNAPHSEIIHASDESAAPTKADPPLLGASHR
jgi:DNA-binding IclR family transcriptional regulator